MDPPFYGIIAWDFFFYFSSSRIIKCKIKSPNRTKLHLAFGRHSACLPASSSPSMYPSLFRVNNVFTMLYICNMHDSYNIQQFKPLLNVVRFSLFSLSSREHFFFSLYVSCSEIPIVGHGNYEWNMESEYIEWCITFEVLIVSASLDFFFPPLNTTYNIDWHTVAHWQQNEYLIYEFILRCFLHRLFFIFPNENG